MCVLLALCPASAQMRVQGAGAPPAAAIAGGGFARSCDARMVTGTCAVCRGKLAGCCAVLRGRRGDTRKRLGVVARRKEAAQRAFRFACVARIRALCACDQNGATAWSLIEARVSARVRARAQCREMPRRAAAASRSSAAAGREGKEMSGGTHGADTPRAVSLSPPPLLRSRLRAALRCR
eukprot:IDg16318t1